MDVYFVKSAMSPRVAVNARSYPNVEAAPRDVRNILGEGADSVWIVDRAGAPILPWDQVKLRLSPSPPTA